MDKIQQHTIFVISSRIELVNYQMDNDEAAAKVERELLMLPLWGGSRWIM